MSDKTDKKIPPIRFTSEQWARLGPTLERRFPGVSESVQCRQALIVWGCDESGQDVTKCSDLSRSGTFCPDETYPSHARARSDQLLNRREENNIYNNTSGWGEIGEEAGRELTAELVGMLNAAGQSHVKTSKANRDAVCQRLNLGASPDDILSHVKKMVDIWGGSQYDSGLSLPRLLREDSDDAKGWDSCRAVMRYTETKAQPSRPSAPVAPSEEARDRMDAVERMDAEKRAELVEQLENMDKNSPYYAAMRRSLEIQDDS